MYTVHSVIFMFLKYYWVSKENSITDLMTMLYDVYKLELKWLSKAQTSRLCNIIVNKRMNKLATPKVQTHHPSMWYVTLLCASPVHSTYYGQPSQPCCNLVARLLTIMLHSLLVWAFKSRFNSNLRTSCNMVIGSLIKFSFVTQ